MARGTAETAVVGKTYRVGGDDWWKTPTGVFILTTDKVVVTGKDGMHVYIDVYRDDKPLSMQRIELCFFDEDFELVEAAQ